MADIDLKTPEAVEAINAAAETQFADERAALNKSRPIKAST